jgi:hypothetical protein
VARYVKLAGDMPKVPALALERLSQVTGGGGQDPCAAFAGGERNACYGNHLSAAFNQAPTAGVLAKRAKLMQFQRNWRRGQL